MIDWKVGDHGKTVGGWEYHITDVNRTRLIAQHLMHPSTENLKLYDSDPSARFAHTYVQTYHDLDGSVKSLLGEAVWDKARLLAPDHRDSRHPIAKARDAFFESTEGRTLLHGSASGEFLRNRIEAAFLAGVREGSRTQTAQIPHALGDANMIGNKL